MTSYLETVADTDDKCQRNTNVVGIVRTAVSTKFIFLRWGACSRKIGFLSFTLDRFICEMCRPCDHIRLETENRLVKSVLVCEAPIAAKLFDFPLMLTY